MNRRRFIQIIAGASLAAGLSACQSSGKWQRGTLPYQWQGRLLGAETSLTLYHPDPKQSEDAVQAVIAEMHRLARIFSLYEAHSELSRLNRDGFLHSASPELMDLLKTSQSLWAKTDGLFDPTMQPLFELYADHFSKPLAEPAPSADAKAIALAKVGLNKVTTTDTSIRFSEPGMAMSLNGIAQGYLTDQAHRVLRERGFKHALVNMGEFRALGSKLNESGSEVPWKIGIADAEAPWQLFDTIDVIDKAVATSAPSGAAFVTDGNQHHLLNPKTGSSENHYISVSVVAPTATLADGLSTALTLMPPQTATKLVAEFKGVGALLRPIKGAAIKVSL